MNKDINAQQKDDYDLAIAEYIKTISLNPNYPAYYNLASAYVYKMDYNKFIANYRGNQTQLNDADVYYNRSLAYYRNVDYNKAIEDYNQAIRLLLSYIYAYYNQGFIYYRWRNYK